MPTNDFPAYPSPSLTRADVVGFLAPQRQRGWDIYQGADGASFVVRLLDNVKLFIEYNDGRWRVSTGPALGQQISIWAYPETIGELDESVRRGVHHAGSHGPHRLEWAGQPTAVRFQSGQGPSNLSKFVALVGSAEIEGIFDSYLDNKSLLAIIDLASLGMRLSSTLRLLTSTAMVQPTKGNPRLTPTFARSWSTQLSLAGVDIRHQHQTGHQRRFALLSGGQSLLFGPSLNNLDVNEAAHLEPDIADRAFFDVEWAAAIQLAF